MGNCRLLGEGVDEPGWDLVVMADGTTSPVDSRQRIGRVSRKAPGKECGYVLVPMPLMDGGFVVPDYDDDDDDDDDDGVRGNTTRNSSVGYKNFVTVFQAMVGEDPKLKQDVLFVMDEMSKSGQPLRPDQFPQRFLETFVLPSSWSYELKAYVMNNVVVEFKQQNDWERMYGLLVVYKNRESHCNIPQGHKENGENLGTWLSSQRQRTKRGTLPSEKAKRLEKLGVVWDPIIQRWERMFTHLVQYKEREGHCRVPQSHKEDGEALGVWLQTQRKTKKKRKLYPKRLRRLEDLGVVWKIQ